MLQDIFWYLFLDKYQTSKNSMIKLFNRTAFNYVKLMMYVNNPAYKDVFFKVWTCDILVLSFIVVNSDKFNSTPKFKPAIITVCTYCI